MADQALISQIMQMRSQSMSNDEIAQRLLYQGYTNAQVFDAISSVDTAPSYEATMPQQEMTVQPSFSYQQQDAHHEQQIDTNRIEEIAESIIEDKWNELIDHVNKIVEWKSSMESKLNTMDGQIKTMRGDFDSLQKAILGKISDSDSVMREVGTDIKALEQVFKKILPGFVENVNELSRITQVMKKK